MTGREIFGKFTEKSFALKAEEFSVWNEFSFQTHEESLEFLSIFLVLLEENKYRDYNEERYLANFKKFNGTLKKNGCIVVGTKKYSVNDGTCTCSAE